MGYAGCKYGCHLYDYGHEVHYYNINSKTWKEFVFVGSIYYLLSKIYGSLLGSTLDRRSNMKPDS